MPTGQLGIPDQQRFPQLLLPGGIDVVLGVGGSNPLLTPCESPARRFAVWTLKPCPSWSFEWGPGGPVGLAPAITGWNGGWVHLTSTEPAILVGAVPAL